MLVPNETYFQHKEQYLKERFEEDQKYIALCSYAGGKRRIIRHIKEIIYDFNYPKPALIADLCAGAGSLSLNSRSDIKVINDANIMLAVIYNALSNESSSKKLCSIMEKMEASEKSYDEACNYWKNNKDLPLEHFEGDELVKAAVYSWLILRLNFRGDVVDPSNLRKLNFSNVRNIENKMKSFRRDIYRFRYAVCGSKTYVYNKDIIDALYSLKDTVDRSDCNNNFIYIDPPYVGSDYYNCKFDRHKELLELADSFPRDKCRIAVSGFDSKLYRDILEKLQGKWCSVFVKEITNNGKLYSGGTSRETQKEYIFLNYIPE